MAAVKIFWVMFLAIDSLGGAYSLASTPNPQDNGGSQRPQNGVNGKMIASAEGPIELGAKAVRVRLHFVGTPGETLGSRLKSLGPNSALYLVLRNPKIGRQPGTLFHIYLDLPPNAKPRVRDRRHVGALNFYGADRARSSFFTYDLMSAVRRLLPTELRSKSTTITISPSVRPNKNARATLARIQLYERTRPVGTVQRPATEFESGRLRPNKGEKENV